MIVGAMLLNGDEIRYLVVSSRHRRIGTAQALIAYSKWRWPTLWVKSKEGNKAAIALWEKEGFRRNYDLETTVGWNAYSWERKRAVV